MRALCFGAHLIYPCDGTDFFLRLGAPYGLAQMQFIFENHTLDTERRELLRGGSEQIPLQPQVFDLLVHLIENRGRVVTKDDLIELVWGGRIVSDSALTSRINAARAAVDDDGKTQKFIRTMPRKGFRF